MSATTEFILTQNSMGIYMQGVLFQSFLDKRRK